MNYKSILLIFLLLFISGCSSASHKNKKIIYSKIIIINTDGSCNITETSTTEELEIKLERMLSMTAIDGFNATLADGSTYGLIKSTVDPDEAAIDSTGNAANNIAATVMTSGASNIINNMENEEFPINRTNDIINTIMAGNAANVVDIIKNKENN